MRSFLRAVRRFVLLLGAAGCYSYSLTPVDRLSVGEPVRARITGAEAERLEPILGSSGREVEGPLLEMQDSGIVVAVSSTVSTEGGMSATRAYQRISIPRSELEEVQVRHLDGFRTGVLVAGGAVGVAAIFAAASGAISLGTGQGKGNSNKSREPSPLPILRLRLPY